MTLRKLKTLLFSIGISQLAGIIGSVATSSSVSTWFVTLNKPFFNPPSWLFGPVWITLYTLMGISLYLVISKGYTKKNIKKAANIFLVHLIFNTAWSLVFFGLKDLALALVVILILLGLIGYLIKLFWQIHKTAAYLLIPYFLWVSFATILNYAIWRLN